MEWIAYLIIGLMAFITIKILISIPKMFKRLFCLHNWGKPFPQKSRGNGMFGLIRQYEWKCSKCNKVKWSDHQDISPS